MDFENYRTLFERYEESIVPIIIDKEGAILLINALKNTHYTTFEEITESPNSGISMYFIPEEKKTFDIATVKRCILDISLIPYEKRHIYLLSDFDTASIEAMNALLKMLEDSPLYACIILAVSNPNSLLSTIHSRAINLYNEGSFDDITGETRHAFEQFVRGERSEFLQILYEGKIEKREAISLFSKYLPYADSKTIEKIEWSIIQIKNGYDSPKYFLDYVFLDVM